jgi:hypothetical protein
MSTPSTPECRYGDVLIIYIYIFAGPQVVRQFEGSIVGFDGHAT